ncbi:CU044_2847 family protein [Actinoplanes subtropicus]|jgi:hypothetical protein|uniref:CU044_2847 family protein n=1 Tax=Actinoplanes subtropicus TaxID=543632 RepID=UPI00068ECE5F|nr:CU044_2847 family protein [Actinoplanes subtropicus]
MTELIQIELPDGDIVWARVAAEGPSDVGIGDRVLPLKGLTETVRSVVSNVRKGLDGVPPDELTAEFAVELALAEGGVVAALVGLQANASVKITATWSANPPQS